jgi:hypothetical protein
VACERYLEDEEALCAYTSCLLLYYLYANAHTSCEILSFARPSKCYKLTRCVVGNIDCFHRALFL